MIIMAVGDHHYTELAYSYDDDVPRPDETAEFEQLVRARVEEGWRLMWQQACCGGVIVVFRRGASAEDPRVAGLLRDAALKPRDDNARLQSYVRIGSIDYAIIGEMSGLDPRTLFTARVEARAAHGWELVWRDDVQGGVAGMLRRVV